MSSPGQFRRAHHVKRLATHCGSSTSIAAAWAAVAFACACTGAFAQAATRPLSSAKEIDAKVATIAQSARHRTRADRAAARELIAQADADYRAGRYDAAHGAYDNATANNPSAYAFIMTGDAHWRAALAFARQPAAAGSGASCHLQREHFVDDLRLDLNQQTLVGLRLAQTARLPPLPGAALRARARSSAACLARLADEYEPLAPQTCIDDAKIARCLGAPLKK